MRLGLNTLFQPNQNSNQALLQTLARIEGILKFNDVLISRIIALQNSVGYFPELLFGRAAFKILHSAFAPRIAYLGVGRLDHALPDTIGGKLLTGIVRIPGAAAEE